MVSLNSLADYHQSLIGCLVMPERPYLNQKHIGVRCKWILERRTGWRQVIFMEASDEMGKRERRYPVLLYLLAIPLMIPVV